jgi:VanZ like family/Concanavalin A-like lectin/glucanases superfamily
VSSSEGYSSTLQTKLLPAICACVLLGILVAGLWPFHAPRNEVSWLGEGNGLLFGKHGSIVSASPFQTRAAQGDNSCSLEIWLKPSRIDSRAGGTILAFYLPKRQVAPFALRQFQRGLVLDDESQGSSATKTEIYVGDVFSGLKPVLVTITSGDVGTATYADGRLLKGVTNIAISDRALTGQFVVGNAPTTAYSWSGQMIGLAIYDRELSAAEVSQGFVDWAKGNPLDSAKRDGLAARYLFDERKGNVVRNQVDSSTNLLIPPHFFVLDEQFLERPWDEFRPTWSYWENVAVNVVGFIPLGFFFYAYFSQLRKAEQSAVLTVALGFAVSLTIEVLQAFLPTRDSGMTDLITNTFGTAVGVMTFRHKAVQAVLAVVGACTQKSGVFTAPP